MDGRVSPTVTAETGAQAPDLAAAAGEPAGLKITSGYGLWVLVLLLAINAVNFIDRTIVNILSQPIKADLHLADWQIGLMGGLTFAVFYASLGLPIARLAERRSRVSIISLAIGAWSLMTALCGLAGNYLQLLACRVGVGVGEAGCSPPAHSLISDYFPLSRRATALSIFSLGVPLGALIGAVFGGWAADNLGWRTAIMLVGAPGLVLAIVARLTLKEPPRGHSEAASAQADEPPSALMDVARLLLSRPEFRHVAAGATLASFAGYGIGQFSAAYFVREFGLSLQTVGLVFGMIGGVSAGLGTVLGGVLTDFAGRRDPRGYALVPAAGLIIASPLYIAAYLQGDWRWAAGLLLLPGVFHYTFLGPSFAITHAIVRPRMRATASALLMLAMTLIGLGLGPLLVGAAGDILANLVFAGDFSTLCPGGVAPHGADAGVKAACMQASATGIQRAIAGCAAVYAWAGLHFALAGRAMDRKQDPAI